MLFFFLLYLRNIFVILICILYFILLQGLLGLMKAFSVEIVVFQSQSTFKKEKSSFQFFSSFKVKVNIALMEKYMFDIFHVQVCQNV